jgi:acetylornithine/N-succinyldiaminopimelate aminotransferase
LIKKNCLQNDINGAKEMFIMSQKKDVMVPMIEEAEKDLLHTYNRYQIVLDHGDGMYLYDANGKKYLDFMAGIAVFAFGYNNKEYNDALKEQIDKIIHTSNYFYNEPAIRAAKKLKEISGMDRVFFTNSGAESVEGAIKAAVKYAYLADGRNDHEIIAMNHSFHGRTYGALSVTGNEKYRRPFGAMAGHVKFAEMNDFQSVLNLVSPKTCAIILEAVQGEGGIIPATDAFLKQLRALCDEKGILLICDEVQCGMGRTGSMFAWQRYGIKPDIMTTAKALGCGIPVGAFLMTEKVAQHSLTAGDHGTTYGGNPLAAAAVNKVLELFEKYDIVNHVNEVTPYFEQQLDQLTEKYRSVIAHRGAGLMQGLVFDGPVNGIIADAMEHGLILINAGPNVIRFLPALIVTKENIDEMIGILMPCIKRAESGEIK